MRAFLLIIGLLLILTGATITLVYCFTDYIGEWGSWAWCVLGSIGYLMVNASGARG
jgi:hypothetical protein